MMTWTRRDVLKWTAGAGVGVALGAPRAFGLPAWLAHGASRSDVERTLVLLELTGGNDGLNTVVPFADDDYRRLRPALALTEREVIRLDDRFGFHPNLSALGELFKSGNLSVLHGVGYPEPNRSHFRSLDIWHSARPQEALSQTGWIGRAADASQRGDFAIHIGGRDLPLVLTGESSEAQCLEQLSDFTWSTGTGSNSARRRAAIEHALTIPRPAESLSERVRVESARALHLSDRVAAGALGDMSSDYPSTELARKFALAAQIIASPLAPRAIFITQTGYDTHSRQLGAHAALLGELSAAIGAFQRDLTQRKLAEQTLTVIYSEFGRRAAENASLGTDHGAAAPVLLVSPALRGGFVGEFPSLANLDDGDQRYTTDFRSLYATLLESWLAIRGASIPTSTDAPLNLFKT